MSVRVDSSEIAKWFPAFMLAMIILCVVLYIIYFLIRRQDNKKDLISRKVTVLEKPVQQGNIEWYAVECENGERLKLRSFQANKVIIAVGDVGIIEYKGQTIQSFQRQA